MREIKFRGKDRTGKWHYGGYVVCTGAPRIIYEEADGPLRALCPVRVIPSTIGQYTGVHDSTELEVYEGDILSDARCRLYVIVWRAGGPCVYNADEYRDLCRKAPIVLHDALADRQVCDYVQEGLTVIGNIHDNPELFDEKKGDTTNVKRD